jgi:DNA-binding response OmpR family regulator
MHEILCVEDGKDTRLILEATLKGYQLVFAPTLEAARNHIRSGSFALILLDIHLPDGNGLEFLAEISDVIESTPVVLLTSKTDLPSKASAFSMGADDFIQKPFDPRELKIRVDAKIRRNENLQRQSNILKAGHLVCHLDEQRVQGFDDRGKSEISLTTREFKILSLLLRAQNKVFSRAEILDRAWTGDLHVTERAVDVHVSNLRKKISKWGVDIEALVGSGYRLHVLNKAS